MTLWQEIKQVKCRLQDSPESLKWTEILDALREAVDQYGGDTEGPWLVVWTAGHGGGIASRHTTATLAAERVRSIQAGDCQCGCAGIVPASRVEELPTTDDVTSVSSLAR